MTQYAVVNDGTNEIVGLLDAEQAPTDGNGMRYCAMVPPVDAWPVAPFPEAVWTWDEGAPFWHDPRPSDLADVQARKWTDIKAERDARELGTFSWSGHSFDVDQTRLTGAAVDAMAAQLAGETYAQYWVLADNTVITLNAAEQIAVGRACKAFIAGLWATSQVLRAEIYAAEDTATVAAVVWPNP